MYNPFLLIFHYFSSGPLLSLGCLVQMLFVNLGIYPDSIANYILKDTFNCGNCIRIKKLCKYKYFFITILNKTLPEQYFKLQDDV